MNPLKGKNKGKIFGRIFLQRTAAFFLDRGPADSAQDFQETTRAGTVPRPRYVSNLDTKKRAVISGGPQFTPTRGPGVESIFFYYTISSKALTLNLVLIYPNFNPKVWIIVQKCRN